MYSKNEPVFYTFRIKTNKCSGNCNNTYDLYAKRCVPDVVKDVNVKSIQSRTRSPDIMSRTNETRHINGMKHVSVYVD